MASEWHYTQNGQPAAAPVSNTQLKQLANGGQLKPDDLVWKEGMPNWAPAGSIKGLFDGAKLASGEMPAANASSASPSAKASRSTKTAPERAKPEVQEPQPSQDREAGPSPGMHPLLVLLLTAVTFGLFGLWFAWQTQQQFAARSQRTTDKAGRPLGQVRHPVLVLVLSYLTLGFYLCWWISQALKECAGYTERRDIQPRTELSLMLIFPLYAVYLAVYRLPRLVREVQKRANLPDTPEAPGPGLELFFFAPCLIVGVPLLCMVQQDQLNQVWINAT
jgi:hypothetical protein